MAIVVCLTTSFFSKSPAAGCLVLLKHSFSCLLVNANEFIVMWYVEQLTAIWQEGLDRDKSPSVIVWVVTEWKKPLARLLFVFIIFSIFFFLKSKLSLLRFDFAKLISYLLLLSLMLSNLLRMYMHFFQRLHQFLSIKCCIQKSKVIPQRWLKNVFSFCLTPLFARILIYEGNFFKNETNIYFKFPFYFAF